MKKILLVTRPIAPPIGDEASKVFAFYLATNLNAFDFYLLTNGFLPDIPKHVHQKPIYTSNQLSFLQKVRLLKLFPKKNNFDIIHFMLTPAKLNALGFKTFLTSKKVKTIQTIATLREDLFKNEDFKKIIFADLVITYSDYAKNKLNSIGFKNVIRIYPGIDLEKYSLKPKDTQAKELFKINDSDFVIMYPGEYTRLGATDDIVSSLPSLFEKIPNAKFVFANRIKNEKDARKKEEVIEILKQKGILDKVVFTDTFSDMQILYNLADIIVFPVKDMKGKFDVPLVAIEAMACEKPVVISDLPILKEFASENNSVIIKTGDMKEFVEKLEVLYENKDLREKIGKQAREYASKNFDIKNVAEQYKTVYEKI